MRHWDSFSPLVKALRGRIWIPRFRKGLKASRVATGSLTRIEVRTASAQGGGRCSPSGRICVSLRRVDCRYCSNRRRESPETPDTEREFARCFEVCFFANNPPTFIRTNDRLQNLASAKVAGEREFITADMKQRAAAM